VGVQGGGYVVPSKMLMREIMSGWGKRGGFLADLGGLLIEVAVIPLMGNAPVTH